MKKFTALFLLLVFMLCGCNQPKDNNNSSSDNQQSNTNNSSTKIEISTGNEAVDKLFGEFLSGEKSAVDKDGHTITINEYLDTTTENTYQKYAIYDMSGDNIPELIIKTPRAFDIFMIKNNAVTLWHSGAWYCKPLNNMAILYERPGGVPNHTDYQYYKLGPNGEEIEKITFSIYSGTEVSGVKYEETYYVNDEKATKELYDSTANPILALSDDNIVWKDLT